MRPLNLVLKGFKGIASGQSKDSITLDLEAIDADARLIAFVGPNGAGKTTIMDNLHPYRVMPSRASTPTPSAFSYYDHLVKGVDALKQLTWKIDDRKFMTKIVMKYAGKTKKQEAYLFEEIDGSWVPFVVHETGLTSDGKTDTYDQAVEHLLGKPEVFFATAFSAQAKKPICSMTTGEIKSLLSSMQGTQSIKDLSDKATQVVKLIKPLLFDTQNQTLPLQLKASERSRNEEKIVHINAEIAEIQSRSTGIGALIEQQASRLTMLKVQASQQELLRVQRANLQSQKLEIEERNASLISDFKVRQKSAVDQMIAQISNEKTMRKPLQANLLTLNQRVQACSLTISKERALKDQALLIDGLKEKAVKIRTEIDDAWLDENKLSQLRQSVESLRVAMAEMRPNGENLAAAVLAAKEASKILNEVPCAGQSFASSCKFIQNGIAAGDSIATKEASLKDLRASYKRNQTSAEQESKELNRLLEVEAKLKGLKSEEEAILLKLNESKQATADLLLVAQAKAEMIDLQASKSGSEALLLESEKRLTAMAEKLVALERDAKIETLRFEQTLQAQVAQLEAQINALPKAIDVDEINLASSELERLKASKQNEEDSLEVKRLELQGAKIRYNESVTASEQLKAIETKAEAISQEITYWTLLSNALGNNGIIAMSIDDAGPSISATCNALLEECYGGRFVVRISTQEATQTGVLKEDFVIHVEDTLRGEQKILDDMSGGEQVWINECLVRAMALFMAQTTGSRSKTLFSDESDGPLDEKRKREFMAMKRSVLDRGSFDLEYMITHTPELWEMCDAVIDVTQI